MGVDLLDTQHKFLVRLINRLIDMPNVNENSSIVTEMITAMIDYATTHFEDEEALLKKYGYPHYDAQRAQHSAFIAKTAEFCADGRLQASNIPASILIYLREWWINHILIDDMKYKSFLREKME